MGKLTDDFPLIAAECQDTSLLTYLSSGSGEKVVWQCSEGHSYSAVVKNRTKNQSGCPYCSGRIPIPGVNDLATLHSELASQWVDSREMSEFKSQARYKALWECESGHQWRAAIYTRTVMGSGCPVCAGKRVDPGVNDFSLKYPHLVADWDDSKPIESFSVGSKTKVHWKCPKGHQWEAYVYSRTSGGRGCPSCASSSYVSNFEKDVADFVRNYFPETETTVRNFKGIYELDIYIPEKNLAIECNGIYWHSEEFKDKNYHADKLKACNSQGIRLIQVWEDDWHGRKDVVKAMLSHKLGVSSLPRIAARKTYACFIPKEEIREFLETHHIQGSPGSGGHYAIGLRTRDSDTLVACMLLRRTSTSSRELRLERYATSSIVAGGQSKLLKFLESEVADWDEIITFADLEVSDGNLYEASGWVKDKVLDPDYRYVGSKTQQKRIHKFNYRITKFRTSKELKYEEGMTERQLAKLNGLLRVYDSGKVRYRYSRPL